MRGKGLKRVRRDEFGWHDDFNYQPGVATTMRDIPEAEARALLGQKLTCEDAEWAAPKHPRGTLRLACGLSDENGQNVGLYAEFFFVRSPSTKLAKFKFTVFRATPHGPARVYQLHVEQMKAAPKHPRTMAHEHIGDRRSHGTAGWLSWSYDDVLHHFCKQTGIVFVPSPAHPEHFDLKG